eukprot:1813771-Amphidinium_carterae.1
MCVQRCCDSYSRFLRSKEGRCRVLHQSVVCTVAVDPSVVCINPMPAMDNCACHGSAKCSPRIVTNTRFLLVVVFLNAFWGQFARPVSGGTNR